MTTQPLLPRPPFKNKPYYALHKLFERKKQGFPRKDLITILKSDSFFELIHGTQSPDKTEWDARFVWQVEEFPDIAEDQFDVFDTEAMVDTVLAIAKDSELCAVISLSNKSDIWYRLYENDKNSRGRGTLKYAYIQTYLPSSCESIFVSFMKNQHYHTIQADCQLYNRAFQSRIYTASIEYNDDDSDSSDVFSFTNAASQDFFDHSIGVSRYINLIEHRPEDRDTNYFLHKIRFFNDCHRRPIGLITWEVNTMQHVLSTSIVRSVMCLL